MKKAKKVQTATWRTVRRDQIHRMERDNRCFGDYWIMLDGDVICIHEQKAGEDSKQKINIPRRVFARMVDQFDALQKMARDK